MLESFPSLHSLCATSFFAELCSGLVVLLSTISAEVGELEDITRRAKYLVLLPVFLAVSYFGKRFGTADALVASLCGLLSISYLGYGVRQFAEWLLDGLGQQRRADLRFVARQWMLNDLEQDTDSRDQFIEFLVSTTLCWSPKASWKRYCCSSICRKAFQHGLVTSLPQLKTLLSTADASPKLQRARQRF